MIFLGVHSVFEHLSIIVSQFEFNSNEYHSNSIGINDLSMK